MSDRISIYLAAAVDHSISDFDPFEWMAKRLCPAVCFNPKSAFRNANARRSDLVDIHDDAFVARINFGAIQVADAVVAYHDLKSTSFGMPMEIMYAALAEKPVVLVLPDESPMERTSIYMRLFASAVLSKHDLDFVNVRNLLESFESEKDLKDKSRLRHWLRVDLGGLGKVF